MNVRKTNTPVLVIGIVLLVLLLGTPFFFRKNSSASAFVSGLWRVPELLEENASMRGELERLNSEQKQEEEQPFAFSDMPYVSAKIFSLYPFNTKNRIFLSIGSDQLIKKGQPVVLADGTLIGTIFDSSPLKSQVITIYDSSFALPVRIGAQETDALLQGGISPRLTLIDVSKKVLSGDTIVSASKDMPYGLVVGTVGDVTKDPSGAFFEASIRVAYNLNSLRTAYILTAYGM